MTEQTVCLERIGVQDKTVILCTLPKGHHGSHAHVSANSQSPARLVPRFTPGTVRPIPLEERLETVEFNSASTQKAYSGICIVCGASVIERQRELHAQWHNVQEDRWSRRHEP